MPSDVDEFLIHYGVAGMKWGRRKSSANVEKHKAKQAAISKKEERKAKDATIITARRAQDARLRKLQEAEGDFYVARTAKGQDKAEKIMRQREKTYFTHPDAATAQKLTTGEKRAVGLAYGAMGLTAISMIVASSMPRH